MIDLHRDMRDAALDARDHGYEFWDDELLEPFPEPEPPEPVCLTCGEGVGCCECSAIAEDELARASMENRP